MVCSFDGARLTLTEAHRFPNEPYTENGTLYWDFPFLWENVKKGLTAAAQAFPLDSVAVDTWGVDFGLLDAEGRLMGNPVHYRDSRTDGVPEAAWAKLPRADVYRHTGIQMMNINTVYQLYALRLKRPELLDGAGTLLFMPDLFTYFLSGAKGAEYTVASTSQLMSPKGAWVPEILAALDIPARLLPGIVPAGTWAGALSPALQQELKLPPLPVLRGVGHDTAAAVVGCPAREAEFAYLSSGTWSLLGAERPRALINADTEAANFTNEGGYNKTTRLLKNVMGLWLLQESRRQWRREGSEAGFDLLMREALAAPAFRSLIDVNDDSFAPPGDMPGRIRDYCRRAGRPVPESRGAVVRAIYESLALAYRAELKTLSRLTGADYKRLYVVGGGSQDELLSQFTADACGVPVLCGPSEATALGSAVVQLIALECIGSLDEARRIIGDSFPQKVYEPQDTAAWDKVAGAWPLA
jgi:rhamnulokinase/L-fuculokinase